MPETETEINRDGLIVDCDGVEMPSNSQPLTLGQVAAQLVALTYAPSFMVNESKNNTYLNISKQNYGDCAEKAVYFFNKKALYF